MRAKTRSFVALTATLAVGLLLGRLFFTDHDHATEAAVSSPATLAPRPSSPSVWTCSMHPQIRQPGPGKCPICGMDLIPVTADHASADIGPRAMSMSPSAFALADIQTTRVERRFPEATVRLVGQLDYDETRLRSLTARFPARIDELFVNYTGVSVARGEHLARIYSPELLTAQRELLSAHAADPDGIVERIARDKLRLWDLVPEQIDAILARGTVADSFELRAPTGGVVVTKNIKEGDYVKTGEPLFRIADLGELWLHLQAFESDLAKLRYGQAVTFTVEAWPGETFTGRIAFIAPQVDPKTRTVPVRVNVANADARLKPGMFARGQVRVKLAGHNEVFAPDLAGKWIGPMHPEIIKDGPGTCDVCGMPLVSAESLGYRKVSPDQAPLVVPSSALLRTGKRAIAYVKLPGTALATFEGHEVVLGSEAAGTVIIVSGLTEGDEVVTQGAFKIDSALQILAKPSMMSATGKEEGRGAKDEGRATTAVSPTLEVPSAHLAMLMPLYLDLQSALATDDLVAAKTAIKGMMAHTGHVGALPELLHAMLAADSLDAFRAGHFSRLSEAFIAAIKAQPTTNGRELLVMHCPMAENNAGANWLQPSEPLRNPYFGAAMLTCGEVVEKLGEGQGTRDGGRKP